MRATIKRAAKATIAEVAFRLGPHRRQGATSRLWILTYHRVLPEDHPARQVEEPGMIVEPDLLERHIGWLREHFELVRLESWLAAAREGAAPPGNHCALTFDDGWLDNHRYAFPVLQAQRAPATIFLVSDMIGTKNPFWPNRLGALLRGTPIATLARHPSFQRLRELARAELRWDGPASLTPLLNALKAADEVEVRQLVDDVARDHLDAPGEPALMGWDQVRELQASGWVDFGSHTQHHYGLADTLPADLLRREVSDSRARIEKELQMPVPLFCYPYGHWCQAGHAVAVAAYDAALTSTPGINTPATDPHRLHRFDIHSGIAATRSRLYARLSGWL